MTESNEKEMRALLERYMAGESRVEEERMLGMLFRDFGSSLPDDLKDYGRMFELMDASESDVDCPEGLEEAIGRRIDMMERGSKLRMRVAGWLSVAAVLAVALLLGVRIADEDDLNLRNLSDAGIRKVEKIDSSDQPSVAFSNEFNLVNGSENVDASVAGKRKGKESSNLKSACPARKRSQERSVRVVNDPEEAARILAMALSELQQSMGMSRDMASEGLSDFSNGLQEIRKQLND